jgi:hypothetical protein
MDLGLFGLSLGRPACPLRPDVFAQGMTGGRGGQMELKEELARRTRSFFGCRTCATLDSRPWGGTTSADAAVTRGGLDASILCPLRLLPNGEKFAFSCR